MSLKKYSFSYYYQGARYSFTIPAESKEEAQGRCRAIVRDCVYDGEIVAEFELSAGFWSSLWWTIKRLLK